jgi:hypothetical protein
MTSNNRDSRRTGPFLLHGVLAVLTRLVLPGGVNFTRRPAVYFFNGVISRD